MCCNIASIVYVLVFWPQGMQDLSSVVRDHTGTRALESKALTAGQAGKSLS